MQDSQRAIIRSRNVHLPRPVYLDQAWLDDIAEEDDLSMTSGADVADGDDYDDEHLGHANDGHVDHDGLSDASSYLCVHPAVDDAAAAAAAAASNTTALSRASSYSVVVWPGGDGASVVGNATAAIASALDDFAIADDSMDGASIEASSFVSVANLHVLHHDHPPGTAACSGGHSCDDVDDAASHVSDTSWSVC